MIRPEDMTQIQLSAYLKNNHYASIYKFWSMEAI